MNEMQRRCEILIWNTNTSITAQLCGKLELAGTLQNVNKGRSGRPHRATDDGSELAFTQSLKESVRQRS
jgi:hypothetical protein